MLVKAADKLRADWSKRERDVMLHFPVGESTRSDGHYLSGIFSKEFTEELTRRGYDISTMKFEISPAKGNPRFRSQQPDPDMTTETRP